jgi:hypothetical protein
MAIAARTDCVPSARVPRALGPIFFRNGIGLLRCDRVVASRPVRRILFGTLRSVGGHPSRPAITRRLQRPTRGLTGGTTLPLLGLAPDGVYRAIRVTPDAGALLPHRFTLTCAAGEPVAIGGLLSVALSCGSPRLGVTQHPALRSPDVPRTDHHSEERVRTRPPGRLATAHHSITRMTYEGDVHSE